MKSASNLLIALGIMLTSCSQAQNTTNTETNHVNTMSTDSSNWKKLTPEEERVIINKGTEAPFKGEYTDNHAEGDYHCRRCNTKLFESDAKFDSGSGWPAFDDAIPGAVREIPDKDGYRIEIVCATCSGHLGHVFKGERFTSKNTRHCVNSISLTFIPEEQLNETVNIDTAIFASGCFWGTEYFFEKAEGVISTQVGYIGGHKENPTYKEVCAHTTGHAEAVMVVYDPSKTNYETLCKLFFETHDPTQVNRQGPDIGDQYRTEVFYMNDEQKQIAEKLIAILEEGGMKVATKVTKATKFWEGEDYHEHYYSNKGGTPYCHGYTKRF
ncbi:MAG: bifunctional methionine sulfoxide reductase B/A protein [Crocinitomicaceae bacterium]|nr:bifunctional methionine sulfoxide reductase B/A protein [Crocinitomicaceae bacterium]